MNPFQSKQMWIALALFLLLWPRGDQAQAEETDGEQVELRLMAFPGTTDETPIRLVVGHEQTIEVEAPALEFSKVYSVPVQSVWTLGQTAEDGSAASFKTLGETPALASSKQLLLLVRKGERNAAGFEVIAVDCRPSAFGGGKFLFLNLSRVEVAGDVGGTKFTLQQGKHAVIAPVPGGDEAANTHVTFREGDRTRPFFSSMWPCNARSRGLVIFYDDPKTERLRLHTIREFLR